MLHRLMVNDVEDLWGGEAMDLVGVVQVKAAVLHRLRAERDKVKEDVACAVAEGKSRTEVNRVLKEKVEKLVEENEKLRRSKEESEARIKSLERLAGPVKDEVIYVRGERPSVIRTLDTMSLRHSIDSNALRTACPVVTVSRVRNRELEQDLDRLTEETASMVAAFEREVGSIVSVADETVVSFKRHTELLTESLSNLETVCKGTRELLTKSCKENALHRLRSYMEYVEKNERLVALTAEVAEAQRCLQDERTVRSAEMAKVMEKASVAHAGKALELKKEAKMKAEEKSTLLKQAAEQRKKDDDTIQSLTTQLGTLSRQCAKLTTARHYEMVGLSSEVGIVKNDLKLLEHHLKRRAAVSAP